MITVTWTNATRPDTERWQIEGAYREALLKMCNSEQHAQKLMDIHAMQPSPYTLWHKFNQYAAVAATAGLLPTERRAARFIVRSEI